MQKEYEKLTFLFPSEKSVVAHPEEGLNKSEAYKKARVQDAGAFPDGWGSVY
jgi:hypothetical protein